MKDERNQNYTQVEDAAKTKCVCNLNVLMNVQPYGCLLYTSRCV